MAVRRTTGRSVSDIDLTILLAKQRVYQTALALSAIATVIPMVLVVIQRDPFVPLHLVTNVPTLLICLVTLVLLRKPRVIPIVERMLVATIVVYIVAWDLLNLAFKRLPASGAVVGDAPVFLLASILLCLVVPQEQLRAWLFGLFGVHAVLNWANLLRFEWGPTQSTQLTTDVITAVAVVALSLVGLFQRLVVTSQADLAAMRDLAHTDTLTQLPNRRAMYALLDSTVELSVALIDLDDFKHVNDSRGHHYGDDVLVRIAGLLRDSAAGVGTVGRWGGEEFLVVMPATGTEAAGRWGESARKLVARTSTEVVTTMSMGVTSRRPEETTADLLRRADELMYLAKRRGKNQVALG
jgi:diguanylate cyclase (GGDEF)-like protein